MSEHSPEATRRAAYKLFEDYFSGSSEAEFNRCLDDLIKAGVWYDQPRGRWLISRHDLVRIALTHKDLLNNLQLARPSTKSWALSQRLGSTAPPVLFLDPPLHEAVRSAFSRQFSVNRIQGLGPWISEQARSLVASLTMHSEFDLAGDLAQPFSLSLILRTFGFTNHKQSSATEFIDDLFALNRLFDLTCSEKEVRAGQQAAKRIRLRVEQEASLMNEIDTFSREHNVPREYLLASIEFSLRAGVVTTSCLLINILLRLFAPPASLNAESVERSIAACTPALEAGRVSQVDVHLQEFTIPAKETVICLLPAANRDLELSGGSTLAHLTFGAGRHRCLGEHLVRQASQSLVAAMQAEKRGLRSLGRNEYHYTPSFRGLRRVPVAWTT